MARPRQREHLGRELGHGLRALRHSVLRELAGEDEAHRRLDLARRERGPGHRARQAARGEPDLERHGVDASAGVAGRLGEPDARAAARAGEIEQSGAGKRERRLRKGERRPEDPYGTSTAADVVIRKHTLEEAARVAQLARID